MINFNRLFYKKASFFFVIICLILYDANAKGDFEIFIDASKDLLNHKNIYSELYNQYFHYYYSVLFALILVPFTYLPLYWAKVIWMCCNYFFTYRIYKIAIDYFGMEELQDNKIKNLLIGLSFAFMFALWHRNIALGQVTIFVLFLMLEALQNALKGNIVLASILLSFGLDFKILPIVLIPYFVYRGYIKLIFLSLLFLIAELFIPTIFLGWDFQTTLLKARWHLLNPNNQEHLLDVAERSFHSLTTFLSVLLVENTHEVYALKLKRNVLNLSFQNLNSVINAVRLFFILLSFYFFKPLFFSSPKNKKVLWYEWSYLLLVAPLLFPHQQHYAFYLCFPAVFYLLFELVTQAYNSDLLAWKRKKVILIASLSFIFILLNSHFLLGTYREYYDHYKTLTYGVLLIIPVLAYFKPKDLIEL